MDIPVCRIARSPCGDMANLTKVAAFVIQLTVSAKKLAQYSPAQGRKKLSKV
jgi:hypothetical protein